MGQQFTGFHARQPLCDQCQQAGKGQPFVEARVLAQIGLSQFEQGGGRSRPMLLHVHESPSQLDESLVKQVLHATPLFEPQFLEDFMGFEKKAGR